MAAPVTSTNIIINVGDYTNSIDKYGERAPGRMADVWKRAVRRIVRVVRDGKNVTVRAGNRQVTSAIDFTKDRQEAPKIMAGLLSAGVTISNAESVSTEISNTASTCASNSTLFLFQTNGIVLVREEKPVPVSQSGWGKFMSWFTNAADTRENAQEAGHLYGAGLRWNNPDSPNSAVIYGIVPRVTTFAPGSTNTTEGGVGNQRIGVLSHSDVKSYVGFELFRLMNRQSHGSAQRLQILLESQSGGITTVEGEDSWLPFKDTSARVVYDSGNFTWCTFGTNNDWGSLASRVYVDGTYGYNSRAEAHRIEIPESTLGFGYEGGKETVFRNAGAVLLFRQGTTFDQHDPLIGTLGRSINTNASLALRLETSIGTADGFRCDGYVKCLLPVWGGEDEYASDERYRVGLAMYSRGGGSAAVEVYESRLLNPDDPYGHRPDFDGRIGYYHNVWTGTNHEDHIDIGGSLGFTGYRRNIDNGMCVWEKLPFVPPLRAELGISGQYGNWMFGFQGSGVLMDRKTQEGTHQQHRFQADSIPVDFNVVSSADISRGTSQVFFDGTIPSDDFTGDFNGRPVLLVTVDRLRYLTRDRNPGGVGEDAFTGWVTSPTSTPDNMVYIQSILLRDLRNNVLYGLNSSGFFQRLENDGTPPDLSSKKAFAAGIHNFAIPSAVRTNGQLNFTAQVFYGIDTTSLDRGALIQYNADGSVQIDPRDTIQHTWDDHLSFTGHNEGNTNCIQLQPWEVWDPTKPYSSSNTYQGIPTIMADSLRNRITIDYNAGVR